MAFDVKFTNLVLDSEQLRESGAGLKITTNIPVEWTKVTFSIPANSSKLEEIVDWCNKNCEGRFRTYQYYLNNWNNVNIVFRFENINDALLIKLCGVAEPDSN